MLKIEQTNKFAFAFLIIVGFKMCVKNVLLIFSAESPMAFSFRDLTVPLHPVLPTLQLQASGQEPASGHRKRLFILDGHGDIGLVNWTLQLSGHDVCQRRVSVYCIYFFL